MARTGRGKRGKIWRNTRDEKPLKASGKWEEKSFRLFLLSHIRITAA